jgi:hypothetical protein
MKMKECGRNVFIPFPKPSQGIEKCKRWVTACSRENFDISNITKHTYICALHWPGEKGPTPDNQDPLKANLTPREIKKASAPKRKAPKFRLEPAASLKKMKADCDPEPEPEVEANDDIAMFPLIAEEGDMLNTEPEYVSQSGMKVSNKETQTMYRKYMLSAKVETMVLRNEVSTIINNAKETTSNLSYKNVSKDLKSIKHFVGLTTQHFEALHSFLDDICPLNELVYWNYGKQNTGLSKGNSGPDPKISTEEKLYITLLRLRRGFTIKTMAFLLSTPDRTIKETTIRKFFTTFIQLIYKVFRDMESVMFPTRDMLRRFLPKVFKTMRNVRCIVDCT